MSTHMVYTRIDWTAFCRWAGNRGLIRRGLFDEGYALHVLLSSAFGKKVLQPFRLVRPTRGSVASLYGYSERDETALREMALTVAPPDCFAVMGVDQLASKVMPVGFSRGQRLGFDIRVRPVRRLGRSVRDSQSGRAVQKGSELDAFRLELLRRAPDGWRESTSATERHELTRESVYISWLGERLEGAASIDVQRCQLKDFRRSRVWRGAGRSSEGPDATLHGECVVVDPEAFASRLRSGVGRHKAYGYGMLILRPPASPTTISATN